jgi:hypothetical protein
MPRLAVCLLTYQRTEYAVRTVESMIDNLRYEGEIGFYVADDGSEGAHVFAVMEALEAKEAKVFGSHSERLKSGPSWNRAVKNALEWADYVLWLEDDWELGKELDVTPYVALLTEREDIGMVRLGYLAVNLKCLTVGHAGRHYLQMSRDTQYAYSGNPSIRHRRYFDAYEWYPGDSRGPGDCEIWHDGKFRAKAGPEIWWPVDLGGWSVWGHIGEKQSY